MKMVSLCCITDLFITFFVVFNSIILTKYSQIFINVQWERTAADIYVHILFLILFKSKIAFWASVMYATRIYSNNVIRFQKNRLNN